MTMTDDSGRTTTVYSVGEALRARARDLDFPAGYFGCCGRSKARGHHELCRRSTIDPASLRAHMGTGG